MGDCVYMINENKYEYAIVIFTSKYTLFITYLIPIIALNFDELNTHSFWENQCSIHKMIYPACSENMIRAVLKSIGMIE